ncbi:aminotransferase class V-fold PLP-dependent enzyme [Caballeronia sp.]|uniref:aminotransferase class V-fold PLP-dependent enzyme n=1 Tax=Caballeronia sp. TaxID=1931223 RepID=UPI003C43FB55
MTYPKDNYDGWLMYHSVGLFPDHETVVGAALADYNRQWCRRESPRWDYGLQARDKMLGLWSRLVGCEPANAFASENVTEAFGRFVSALGPARLRGKKVLIAADCFPSLHFLLSGLAERIGFHLVTVPLAADASYVTDDAFIEHWDNQVALAIITWVTSTASKRADLDRLAEHGRARQSLIAVDITQAAGVLDFNVSAPRVDFVASTALKWLCGAPGTGLAYIAPHLLDEGLAPLFQGWFSQPDPFNWDITRFSLATEARRFDNGTPSFLPFIASTPGLEWLLAQPRGSVRAHNLMLSHRLVQVVDNVGFELSSPRADDQRGGSVMARLPEGLEADAVVRELRLHGFEVDSRGRTLRFSPGPLTTAAALDRLEPVLQKLSR